MKNKILFFLIFFSSYVFSQEYKLGKVTVEELKEKIHPIDSSASATILFKKGETEYVLDSDGHWSISTEVDYKIKIYKKDGLDKATQSFSYYVGGSKEKVFISNAVTYNLEKGEIVKTKLKSEGEFEEELNENWKVKKITMPNVKEGSIIEFSTRLVSPYIQKLDDFYFQSDIPVNHVEYNLYIPEYFNYRVILNGYEKIKHSEEVIRTNTFVESKNSYVADNLPAIKVEEHVHNVRNYLSAVKSELVSVSYPSRPIDYLSKTWEDVVKTIYDNDNFGKQLNLNSYFEDDLNLALKDVTGQDDKILKVLKFVQDRITWNEKKNYLCRDGVKKAYKDRTGNSAEINLMLIAMLRYAGIDANPILVSTRSNGFVLFPTTNAFNYVIAGIEVSNDVILLDATSKNSLPDIIPLDALNWTGRIIRKNGSSAEIDLTNIQPALEVNSVLAELDVEGQLKGKVRRQYYGYNAFVYNEYLLKISEEDRIDKIEKRYNNILIDEYKVKSENNVITEQFSFEHSNVSEKIGDKIYISPALFFNINENPFKSSVRKYPIDFEYPYKDSYKISINIPEGYKVEKMPTSLNLAINGGYASYTLSSNSSGNSIQVAMDFGINSIFIPATEYESLKGFYNEVIKTHEDRIVLVKI